MGYHADKLGKSSIRFSLSCFDALEVQLFFNSSPNHPRFSAHLAWEAHPDKPTANRNERDVSMLRAVLAKR